MCQAVAALAGVRAIVHAASRDQAGAHGFVLPASMDGMLAAKWQAGFVRHEATPGDDEPFERYVRANPVA
jgi:hypothetical protein